MDPGRLSGIGDFLTGVDLHGAPEREEWVGKSVWKELNSDIGKQVGEGRTM